MAGLLKLTNLDAYIIPNSLRMTFPCICSRVDIADILGCLNANFHYDSRSRTVSYNDGKCDRSCTERMFEDHIVYLPENYVPKSN